MYEYINSLNAMVTVTYVSPFPSLNKIVREYSIMNKVKKGKTVSVTDRGGPYGCEMSRLPHFLDNSFTNGGQVVSLTRRPPFTHYEDSWY
jgi:hypothetical protein